MSAIAINNTPINRNNSNAYSSKIVTSNVQAQNNQNNNRILSPSTAKSSFTVVKDSTIKKMTAVEIHKMLQNPFSPELVCEITEKLGNKSLNPDDLFANVIYMMESKEYLIILALCLRFGANPDMYVIDPDAGDIHIMAYIYITLFRNPSAPENSKVDIGVLNTLVLMMISENTKIVAPIFNPKTKSKSSESSFTNPMNNIFDSGTSVKQWLSDQGYDPIFLSIDTRMENNQGNNSDDLLLHDDSVKFHGMIVDKTTAKEIYVMLDKDDCLEPEDFFNESLLELAIRSFSDSVVSKAKINTDFISNDIDNKSMVNSVKYINYKSFIKFLELGCLPSYILINKMLLNLRLYNSNKSEYIERRDVFNMLISSIENGVIIDKDQYNIIIALGPQIKDNFDSVYKQPYWKKTCKSSQSEISNELEKIAIDLNIDTSSSKNVICQNITSLSKYESSKLVASASEKERVKLSIELGMLSEFIDGKAPNLICRNKTLMENNITDYNDIDTANYRDENGAIWCFVKDSFDSLIDSGQNPYTIQPLPENFIQLLKNKRDVLKKLNLYSEPAKTFKSSVSVLTEKDVINNIHTDYVVKGVQQLALINNVRDDTLKSLSIEQMTEILNNSNINYNFTGLTRNHSFITFCYIISFLGKKNLDNVTNIFDNISNVATKSLYEGDYKVRNSDIMDKNL
jgi:hypothetical protein